LGTVPIDPATNQPIDDKLLRIARRGITYGNPAADPLNVGLMFMSYQADLQLQFVTLQGWANSPIFPSGLTTPKYPRGLDPMIGRHQNLVMQSWPVAAGQYVSCPVRELVELQGGEFFFTPSISGLRELACT
jgi:hypothetical protein